MAIYFYANSVHLRNWARQVELLSCEYTNTAAVHCQVSNCHFVTRAEEISFRPHNTSIVFIKKFSGDNECVIMTAYFVGENIGAALTFSKFCISLCKICLCFRFISNYVKVNLTKFLLNFCNCSLIFFVKFY